MIGFHMKIGGNVQPYTINPPTQIGSFAPAGPFPWYGQLRNDKQKEVAWKTVPCWHFVNNEGECPHGAYCAL